MVFQLRCFCLAQTSNLGFGDAKPIYTELVMDAKASRTIYQGLFILQVVAPTL